MKVRQHRGSLADSMATVVEIEPTRQAVADFIRLTCADWDGDESGIKVEPYGYDRRIGWDTHVVTVVCRGPGAVGVFGFTDGPVESLTGTLAPGPATDNETHNRERQSICNVVT